jgi:hypothetical protein
MDGHDHPLNEPEQPDPTEALDDVAEFENLEPPGDLLVEVDTLRVTLDERTEALHAREQELAEGSARERVLLSRYREALAASDPDLTTNDITGGTLEELDASFDAAKDFAARVRASTAATEAVVSVPAGAPGRRETAPATSFEKIRDGLAARG